VTWVFTFFVFRHFFSQVLATQVTKGEISLGHMLSLLNTLLSAGGGEGGASLHSGVCSAIRCGVIGMFGLNTLVHTRTHTHTHTHSYT